MSDNMNTMRPLIAQAISNPALTCATSCEGNAYQIAIRQLKRHVAELQAELKAAREHEPVAAQARFVGSAWSPCAVEHHQMVQACPEEWKGYETRALYASAVPAEQPVNARLLEALSACLEYGSMTGAEWVEEKARSAIAAAEAQQAEIPADDGSLTLDKGEVEFLAARMRRLLAKFGEHEPEKDDRFIVGVAGSLIGNLLTNIKLKEKAGPVRMTSKEINACLNQWRSSRHETYENLAWIVEAAALRANGFNVEG